MCTCSGVCNVVHLSGCVPGPAVLDRADWTLAVPWSQLLCLAGDHEEYWDRYTHVCVRELCDVIL